MIDLGKLYEQKQIFGFFAHQLSYPEKLTFHPSVFEEFIDSSHPVFADVHAYWEKIHELSLDDIIEHYTDLFDFQKDSTLFMTYVKFGDSKERGQMLARLKVLYEMFGFSIPQGELSDFLPIMCEFIYAADWLGDPRAEQSFSLLLAVLEDGSYHLMKALEKYDSPYLHLVKAMRDTCKLCIHKEVPAND